MKKFHNLTFELQANGVAIITINRPDKMNALNHETIQEIGAAIEEVERDEKVLAAILTGSGAKAFVAGADIAELSGLDEATSRKFSEAGQDVFLQIEECNKVVIAAINGFALGGGCELAMACHIRIASKNAKFGMPEITLGLIPGFGGTQRLPRLVGKAKALEMMLTADMITADDALNFGLVNYVLDSQEELMAKANEILNKIITKAPIAAGHIIECVNSYYEDDNGFQQEANSFAACFRTNDFREGVSAFLEKRKPSFKNN